MIGTTIWMTGLSGSGKSTIANRLSDLIPNSVLLDGDVVRSGLCSDLGFTIDDRKENIRRIACLAKIMSDNGLNPIVPAITPCNEIREMAQKIVGTNFHLVWVKCPLEICEDRDVKGLYAKARKGELKQFTGIDSPFEIPNAEITCDTSAFDLDECVSYILKCLRKLGMPKY